MGDSDEDQDITGGLGKEIDDLEAQLRDVED